MRYLVHARVRPGKEEKLLKAIEKGTLGRGSVAGHEYLHDMSRARLFTDGQVRWVETCFCDVPLAEERAYWEEFFELFVVWVFFLCCFCFVFFGFVPCAFC